MPKDEPENHTFCIPKTRSASNNKLSPKQSSWQLTVYPAFSHNSKKVTSQDSEVDI